MSSYDRKRASLADLSFHVYRELYGQLYADYRNRYNTMDLPAVGAAQKGVSARHVIYPKCGPNNVGISEWVYCPKLQFSLGQSVKSHQEFMLRIGSPKHILFIYTIDCFMNSAVQGFQAGVEKCCRVRMLPNIVVLIVYFYQ